MSALEVAPKPLPEAPPAPAPLIIGSFALFETGDGGFVIAWKRKGHADSRQLPIPAALLMMASAQTGKSRDEIIRELTGGGE